MLSLSKCTSNAYSKNEIKSKYNLQLNWPGNNFLKLPRSHTTMSSSSHRIICYKRLPESWILQPCFRWLDTVNCQHSYHLWEATICQRLKRLKLHQSVSRVWNWYYDARLVAYHDVIYREKRFLAGICPLAAEGWAWWVHSVNRFKTVSQ